MNWYKNQLDRIADDCFKIKIPSSARIKKDIDYVTESDMSIANASKIRNIIKEASSSNRKEKKLEKIIEFIDPAYKDQIMGIISSYLN